MFVSVPYVGRQVLNILATLFAAWILFGAWALSSPVGSSADETAHLIALWCGDKSGGEYCTRDADDVFMRNERRREFLVPAYVADGLSCMKGNVGVSASCQVEKAATQRESLFLDDSLRGYGTYPGLFYESFAGSITSQTEESVLRIRIINGMLAGVLIVLLVSIQTPANRGNLLGHALLAGLVPPVMFLVPSVNPTSWTFIGIPAATIGIQNFLDGKLSLRLRAVSLSLALAAGGLALGARLDARLWLALIMPCLILSRITADKFGSVLKSAHFRTKVSLLLGATVISATVIVASPYAIGRYVTFGEPIEGPARSWWRLLLNNLVTLPDFLVGFIGGGTWNVAAHQRFIVPSLTIACCLVVLCSTSFVLWRGAGSSTRMLSVSIAILGIVSILAIHQANSYYIGKIIQPRYVFPIFLSALLILGQGSRARLSMRWSITMILVASLGHSILLYQHFRRYLVGLREWTNDDLGCVACEITPTEWWWKGLPAPVLIWIAGSLSFLVLAKFLVTPRCLQSVPRSRSKLNE